MEKKIREIGVFFKNCIENDLAKVEKKISKSKFFTEHPVFEF
jgi:hypothetical protein